MHLQLNAWHLLRAAANSGLMSTSMSWLCSSLRRLSAMALAIIAATALVHGMTVVTRNVSDFAPTRVDVLNPWE